jgi:hypothetical protein
MVAGTLLFVSGLALSYQVNSSCPPDTLCEHYLRWTLQSLDATFYIPMASTGRALFLIGMTVLVVLWVLYLRLNKQTML